MKQKPKKPAKVLPKTQREVLGALRDGWSLCRGVRELTVSVGPVMVHRDGSRLNVDRRVIRSLMSKGLIEEVERIGSSAQLGNIENLFREAVKQDRAHGTLSRMGRAVLAGESDSGGGS